LFGSIPSAPKIFVEITHPLGGVPVLHPTLDVTEIVDMAAIAVVDAQS
jgi:hypothetical protein